MRRGKSSFIHGKSAAIIIPGCTLNHTRGGTWQHPAARYAKRQSGNPANRKDRRKTKGRTTPSISRRNVTALNMRAFTGRRAAHRSPLVGQSVAALCTTARKHLAAIAGRHSFAEAMLLGALAFLRLISSKHFSAPPSFVRCPDGHRQMPVRAP